MMLIDGPLPPGIPLVPMYTIYPPEVWWSDWEDIPGPLRLVTWHGRWVLVSEGGCLERLLSTYRPDFLVPRFQPGARLFGVASPGRAAGKTAASPSITQGAGG